MSKELDLSCFSYLASARVLQISKYPELNSGAEVLGVIDTLSADGPMVAIAASRLGLKVGLVANSLGKDEAGVSIKNRLETNNIINSINKQSGRKTPFIVVLSDLGGNREWFAYIRNAQEELLSLNLSLFNTASLAYIDLYASIQEASFRAIDYADKNNVPVFLNFSGDIPSTETLVRLANKNVAVTQIGLHESQESSVERVIRQIYDSINPKVSIVTLASKGAVAFNGKTVVRTQAYPVDILHVHGAGAAFSAGFTYGYLRGWGLQQNLEFACALGSLNCTKERGFEEFTMDEIDKLLTRQNS